MCSRLLYDISHVDGSNPYTWHALLIGHVSWVGFALQGRSWAQPLTTAGEELDHLSVYDLFVDDLSVDDLLLGTAVNRTYGEDKNLCISLFLPTIFCPIYYGPP